MTDNMGAFAQLVDEKTIEEISVKFPRNKWTGCFADVVKDEVKLKPWAHTTAMGPSTEDIVNGILGNKTTAKYD
jgi:cyanamide hydratase